MDEKQRLRALVRTRRDARLSAAGDDDSVRSGQQASFTAQLASLTEQLGADRVACFVSVRGEPETAGYLAWARAHGVEVLLPRVRPGGSLEWSVHEESGLAVGAFSIPEPVGPATPMDASERVDLLLVPAAAVDQTGTRLGWGRGYFDRELARLRAELHDAPPQVFAVVWSDELMDRLPQEPHDIPVDGAVTEESIHRFG